MNRASNFTLRAIEAALQELEGDESLGRRMRAVQEIARLLYGIETDDANVFRLCRGRAVPSLLTALMDEVGEHSAQARNAILQALAHIVHFVDSPALADDSRLWALLLRMLYQTEESTVSHALSCMERMSDDTKCLDRLQRTRRVVQLIERLSISPDDDIARSASFIAERVASYAARSGGAPGGGASVTGSSSLDDLQRQMHAAHVQPPHGEDDPTAASTVAPAAAPRRRLWGNRESRDLPPTAGGDGMGASDAAGEEDGRSRTLNDLLSGCSTIDT